MCGFKRGEEMFGEHFELNEQTLHVVQEIGRHMPGGFFIYKAEQPEELLYANEAVVDIYGCDDLDDLKRLTGFTFKGMLHPDDYRSISKSIEEQVRGSEDKNDYVEYRIIRKDGVVRWVDDYGHYTETDAYGGIYYVFISDITDKRKQKEMEARLALQEQLLEAGRRREEQSKLITALASDYRGVYYVQLDDDEGMCYQEHSELDRGPKEGGHFPYLKSLTRYGELYVTEQYRDQFIQFIQPESIREGLRSERVISFRYLVNLDGEESFEMIKFAGVRHPEDRDDNIVHAVGMCFADVDGETRRSLQQTRALAEALEAAEEASRAKTVFLSNMSHEIRTPMNAIIGLDSIALSNPNIPQETREELEQIGVSAKHLLGIINDILDMSRIESGRLALTDGEFAIAKTLEQVNTIIGGQCSDKGIDYECHVKGELADYYIGDDMKLRQVMINVLGNAVKFTPAGGKVTFTVEEVARAAGMSTLQLTVADTGIGISEDYLPKIFEAFSQEDSSAANKYGSTGLGLSITKNLVELMGGTISVQSEKGVGTTFTLTVTLANSDRHDEAAAGDGSAAGGHTHLEGRRVLLAEDVAVNAEIMVVLLDMHGMEADVAENGQVAVDKFASHEPGYYSAVLMDMRMPVMNGLEATEAIRGMDRADAARIPIIALTANAFDEDVQRSMQAGLDAHLSKPVEADALFATLEALIEQREQK